MLGQLWFAKPIFRPPAGPKRAWVSHEGGGLCVSGWTPPPHTSTLCCGAQGSGICPSALCYGALGRGTCPSARWCCAQGRGTRPSALCCGAQGRGPCPSVLRCDAQGRGTQTLHPVLWCTGVGSPVPPPSAVVPTVGTQSHRPVLKSAGAGRQTLQPVLPPPPPPRALPLHSADVHRGRDLYHAPCADAHKSRDLSPCDDVHRSGAHTLCPVLVCTGVENNTLHPALNCPPPLAPPTPMPPSPPLCPPPPPPPDPEGIRRVVCGVARPGVAPAVPTAPVPPRGGRRHCASVARSPRARAGVAAAPQGAGRLPRALTQVCVRAPGGRPPRPP